MAPPEGKKRKSARRACQLPASSLPACFAALASSPCASLRRPRQHLCLFACLVLAGVLLGRKWMGQAFACFSRCLSGGCREGGFGCGGRWYRIYNTRLAVGCCCQRSTGACHCCSFGPIATGGSSSAAWLRLSRFCA